MEDQAENQQGATDEPIAQAPEGDLGGQPVAEQSAGTEPEAASGAPVDAAPAETVASAEETTAVTGDGHGEALQPVDEAAGEQTGAAILPAPAAPAPVTLRDHMDAKLAAVTVTMRAPEDGTCNPHTVSGTTYAAEPGTETTVQAQHTYSLLDAGWKIVTDGWEEAHAELRHLRDEMAAIPEALHHLHAPHLSDILDRVKRWFE